MASIFEQIGKIAASAANQAKTAANVASTAKKVDSTVPSSNKTSSSSNTGSSSNTSSLINKAIDIANAATGAAIKSTGLPATNAVTKAVNNATNSIKKSVSSPTQAVPTQPQIDPNLANQIQELIGVLKQSSQPKPIPQYQSKYDGQIAQLLNQYNSMPEFQFDATNNPTIQAYQKQAADSAYRDARRRNMGYSTVATEGAAEAIANVLATMGPQLEQQAYNQYRDQGQNILQQLQYLQSLDANDYARHMDAYNMGTASNQNHFNNTASIIDMMNKLDTQDYNRQQAAQQTEYAKQQDAIKNAMNESQLTGYYNPYAGMEISPEVQQYASDYQAEINRRRATPDTADDALIPQLEAARANKIFSSPDLLNQYGAQYKTIAQQATDLQNQIAQEQAKLQADPNSYENQKKYYELAMMAEELNQLSTYGAQEQQLKLREIESRIKENAASASASYALAEQRKKEGSNSQISDELKYKDYYEYGKELIKAGNYDSVTGEYKRRYTDSDVFEWVKGLPLTAEQKAKLANDIGLKEPVKETTPNSTSNFSGWLGVNGLIPR